ncbi:MAG TPA: glycoside hydrolase family 28 protein [Bryobacteraceae bacterium]|nr:glycoside hydrolase family 28 protein [Bryobacteraceae bacterium]
MRPISKFVLAAVAGSALVSAAGVPRTFDVTEFGAVGDGTTLATPAINKAIDTAAAAGGGTVYFPAGTFLSGSIHLKSNVALYLDQGSTILASSNPPDYDRAEPNQWDKFQDFGHSHFHNALIWGENLENIAILGPGRIWGKGLMRNAGPRPDGAGSDQPDPAGRKLVGDKAISLKLCHNVTIKDVSILMGGWFAILANGVDNFTIDNVRIDTNRDGMDIISCRNVRVSNAFVNSPYDDGICLKSDYALGFLRSDENITITNSQVSGYDVGTLLDGTFQRKTTYGRNHNEGPTGRIKFGTESNGGFKNITISNVVFDYCRGLALETVDGALLEDVTISNITMRDIQNAPIFMRLGARMRGPEATPVGALRRVSLSDFTIYNADPRFASIIAGIPGHDIEDVRLSNIRIYYQGGGTTEQAALAPEEMEKAYPEPRMFGDIPAYGFFIRHVDGVEMSRVQVSFLKDDLRPAFVLQSVKEAAFDHLKAQHLANVPTFVLKDVTDFDLRESAGLPDTSVKSTKQKEF